MNNFFRNTCLFLFLLILSGVPNLYGQQITSASGVVKDAATGELLPFVSVYFDGSTIGGMTDDEGLFSIQNDKGYTKLAAASLGYATETIELQPGQTNTYLVISLKPTAFESPEVVVKHNRAI